MLSGGGDSSPYPSSPSPDISNSPSKSQGRNCARGTYCQKSKRRPIIRAPLSATLVAPAEPRGALARRVKAIYAMISVTWPEATVWPPSRMANFSPFSIAIG